MLNLFFMILSILLLTLCLLYRFRNAGLLRNHPFLKQLLSFHAVYGMLLLISAFIHGILAGKQPGMLTGKLAWICLLFILLHCGCRKWLSPSGWSRFHRRCSHILCCLILMHVLHAVLT